VNEMKRCSLMVLFAVLIPFSLAATSAAAQRDSVTGIARHLGADPPFPVIQVGIDASADASGADPQGHVRALINTLGTDDRARVICLNVRGNRATIGTEIMQSNDPTRVGEGQLWSVVDNGTSGADRIAGYPITPTPPTACPPLPFNVPVVSGDYVIHDAAPSSTAGWEGFITNQASGCSARVQKPFLDGALQVAANTEVFCPQRTQLTIRSRLRADYAFADLTMDQRGCSAKPDCVRSVPRGFSYYHLACPKSGTRRHNTRYYTDLIFYPGDKVGKASSTRSRDATLSPYCLW
jgi:hypothetical protein